MSPLHLIWNVSLLLAGAALATMILLILARLVDRRRQRRRAARRRQLVSELLQGTSPAGRDLKRLPPDLVTDTFLDLMRLVRGEERARLVAHATDLGVADQLVRRARSLSARKRLLAVQSLAPFHDEDSLGLLHAALEDGNEDVRLAAALALAETGRSDQIHYLVERLGLGTEQSSLMMVTLFRAVAEDRPDEIKALVLAEGTNVQARLAAIEALAIRGDYSVVPTIAALALAAADDSEELPRYLRALGMLGHPAGRDAVMDGLSRSTTDARAAAATAAGGIGLRDSADILAALLDDGAWSVRFAAAEALMRLGEPGRSQLREAARGGSEVARAAAATVLAEHGQPA